MTQDQAEQAERKKEWAKEQKMTFWDSLKINKELGERMFTFLQLGFNDCTAQFQVTGLPPTRKAPMFLDVSTILPQNVLSFALLLLNIFKTSGL